MKKLYIIATLLGAFFLQSCDDRLDLAPFDAIDAQQAFDTPAEFSNALRGTYGTLRDTDYFGGEFMLLPDAISDNLIICTEGRFSYQDYYNFNVNGNIAWLDFYRAAYVTINAANYIIENIDNLDDGEFKDNILGQALGLRAMAHFDLARVYAEAPQFAGPEDLGLPYVTSTNTGLRPARLGVQETFDRIEADFLEAEALISEDNGTGYLNKASVNGLLARFYLYSNDFQNAELFATAAIAEPTNTGVADISEFPDIWIDASEVGVAFKVINTNIDDVNLGSIYNQASPEGIRSEYVPDFELFTEFQADDIRLTWFETSSFAGSNFNHIVKYLQRPGSNQGRVDMKVLRWSEIYLTRAEARFQNGDPTGALSDLNEVRSNRYSGFVNGNESGAALGAEIARQRRLELAFEGHRMFDLKRKGLPIQRSNNGDLADGTGRPPESDVLTLPASSPVWVMPIPQEELNANVNMEPNPSNG